MRRLEDLSLAELRCHVESTYRRGGGTRPDVLLIGFAGQRGVLKDFGACDRWFAAVLGPVLAWREARALRRLERVEGVPRLLGRPDARSLLLEYLSAVRLCERKDDTDWVEFFARLERLLQDIHAQGIAHCDMRSPFNTLIDVNAHPVVVDFVASVSRGSRWNVLANWTFKRFALADRDALVKLKMSVAPAMVGEHEYVPFAQRSALERTAVWLGSRIRLASRRLFTRRG